MLFKNTKTRYGVISILLHWLLAILIIALLIIGLYMTRIPISPLALKLYRWHKEFGMLVLMLVFLRFYWRVINLRPTLNSLPWWEQIAARSVHWMFYIFMIALPITGWLLSSAAGIPVSFFGLFVFPNLIAPNESARIFLTDLHELLGYFLIGIIALHIVASLKHFFINKDEILQRMLWP